MNGSSKQQLEKIAKYDANDIGYKEENIKYNVVVPILECMGHRDHLIFEYGRGKEIDIFIKDLPPDCSVIIETKKYDADLNRYLGDLENYARSVNAILAVIANGKEIRIYSPFMRGYKFEQSLLHLIKRKDLKNDSSMKIIEHFLSRENLVTRIVKDFIREREKELHEGYLEIEKLIKDFEKSRKGLVSERTKLERKLKEVKEQIEGIDKKIHNLEKEENIKIQKIRESLRLPAPLKPSIPFVSRRIPLRLSGKIEIELKTLHTPRRYNLILIPREYRHFFPGYKVEFILETDVGEIKTRVTSAPKGTQIGDPIAGNYIQGGLTQWYKNHPELKPGDKLLFEIVEAKKRYRLRIVKK